MTTSAHLGPLFCAVSQKGKDGGGRSLKTPQYCDACDETVMGETNWKKHLLKTSHIQAFANKSGTTCEPISCDVCGRNFIRLAATCIPYV